MSGPSVKIPADWLDRDETEQLGADVAILMLSALGYSARQLSEGVVPRRRMRKLWPVDDLEKAIELLVEAGEVDDQGDDLLFVNWQDFLLQADEVEQIKEKNRLRDRRRRRHNRGDHAICLPKYCKDAPREKPRGADVSSHAAPRVSHGDPDRTDPDRPLGRVGRDWSADAPSAGATGAGATGDMTCLCGHPTGLRLMKSGDLDCASCQALLTGGNYSVSEWCDLARAGQTQAFTNNERDLIDQADPIGYQKAIDLAFAIYSQDHKSPSDDEDDLLDAMTDSIYKATFPTPHIYVDAGPDGELDPGEMCLLCGRGRASQRHHHGGEGAGS
jgi:hypothetical protein